MGQTKALDSPRRRPALRLAGMGLGGLLLSPGVAFAEPSGAPEGPAGAESASGDHVSSELDVSSLASKSLEELLDVKVVTATKTERKVSEAPAVITVVTREDIALWGYQSLAEVLSHTVGFYVVDDHTLPNAGVRGVAGGLFGESGGIKLMIDGQSVAFRSTGGNWLGPELVPLSAVERIEIIRGPSSALYGADAFLGVVNVITRRGGQVSGANVRSGLSFSSRQDPGFDQDLTAGGRKGPLEVMLSTRLHEEDRSGLKLPSSSPAPLLPSYNLNDPRSRGADQTSKVALARATYHYSKQHSLSLIGYLSTFDRGVEFSPWTQMSYGLDSDGRLHQTRVALRQSMVGLVQESTLANGGALTVRGFYFSGRPTAQDRIDVGSEVFEVRREFGYEGLEGSVEGRIDLARGLGAVIGSELIVDRERLPSNLQVLKLATDRYLPGDVVESSSTRQGKKQISNVGAYAQALWTQLEPYVSAIGGARYDYHSIYGGQLSGRFGAVSNPIAPLFLKLLYGSAFKAPSPLMLYAVPLRVGDIMGNPNLGPQRVHTVEGQVTLKPFSGLVASTGLAYSRLLNMAEFVQQGVNRTARNLSEVSTLSWESEAAIHYQSWLRAYASFELPITVRELGRPGYEAELVGRKNVIYPSHILRAGVAGMVPGVPLRASLEAAGVGARRASEMNILERGSSYELDPYLMLDATLSTAGITFLENRETVLMVKGHNLLNVKGPDPGFAGVDYPLLPFSVLLQLRQEL